MAKGYIKGANGKEIEIVDVTARKSANLVQLPSAAIPAVNGGTIDYTIGETELYLVYEMRNVGANTLYQLITEAVNYKAVTLYGQYAISDEMWAYPEVRNASTYPHYYCKKLDTSTIDAFYAENGLSGTRKLTVNTNNSADVYDGTNANTAKVWLLNRPASIREWQNKFPEIAIPSENFATATRRTLPNALGVYNALDYGVSPDNEDNTLVFQTLVNEVNANGGGVIFVPSGVYQFDTAGDNVQRTGLASLNGTLCCIKAKNYVSIRGESLTETVFKVVGNSANGVAMFGYLGTADNPLVGCTYENFTVDASETTIDTYSSDGKAFFYQYVKNCIFRDLRLIGTPATAMGNDFLDNVVMDSIYVYNAGRIHADNSPGGAGIGIGTGKYEHENFVVRNCICDSCGHFGIFCEDQALFDPGTPVLKYPKGMTIANNIVRNCRNYGIGLRGGMYALVTGNNVYSNVNGGIYLDFGAEASAVMNNLICNEVNGICFGEETKLYACNNIVVTGNAIIDCENDIVELKKPTNTVCENNTVIPADD